MPADVNMTDESYEVTSQTTILFAPEFADSAQTIHDMFSRAGNIDLKMTEVKEDEQEAKDNSICLFKKSDEDYATTESYRLASNAKGVTISASGPAGAFYGTQTLRQLLPDYIEGTKAPLHPYWIVPGLTIKDTPALGWRGAMLDTSRHFHPVDQLKKFLDGMALLKLNRFHWHLTDNQGWRIQIDKYPKLTELAAMRAPVNGFVKGYYDKNDIKDIVAYAKARYIEVIPEIEIPAHSSACMAAYPELSCKSVPFEFPDPKKKCGEFFDTWYYELEKESRHFCAGNEQVYSFLNDVFDEMLDLFPYGIWHIGGDERPDGVWSKCPKCQDRMKKNNIKDEHDLQEWMMRRISDILASKGKTVISWGCTRDQKYYNPEYVDNLGNNSIVLNWHGYAKMACQNGMRCVNACSPMYIDYPPFENYPGFERPSWMPFCPISSIYQFDPIPEGLTPEQEKLIIGTQVCIWCEFLPTDELFAWIYPRMLAASEVAWLPKEKRDSYGDFCRRVDDLEVRFSFIGIPFAHPVVGGNKGDQHRR